MNTLIKPLIDDYLLRLAQAARVLPRGQADELVDEIAAHINSALGEQTRQADVLNILDALGSPQEIVAAAKPDEAQGAQRGLREIAALILLVTGLPPILGWLAGLALLLWSPLWTGKQKLLGALVFPGGITGVMGGAGMMTFLVTTRTETVQSDGSALVAGSSSGNPIIAVLLGVLVLAPLLVSVYLYRAAGRQSASSH